MGVILLVEDELLILDTTREILELLDHQVFAVSSGGAALNILAEQNGKIDLVLLDLSLQDMNGYLLLPQLSDKYPTLKIVIFTGNLPDELDFKGQPIVKGILNKPFELNELRDIVSKIINED